MRFYYSPLHLYYSVLDLIGAGECAACGTPGHSLCKLCISKLEFAPPAALQWGREEYRCRVLLKERYVLRGISSSSRVFVTPVYSAFTYNETVRNIVAEFKVRNYFSIALRVFSKLLRMYADFDPFGFVDLLFRLMGGYSVKRPFMFYPASSRIKQRGFDHIRLIARVFANVLGINPIYVPVHSRSTLKFSSLNREERLLSQREWYLSDVSRSYLESVFGTTDTPTAVDRDASQDSMSGHVVLIVDDIITTGVTIHSLVHFIGNFLTDGFVPESEIVLIPFTLFRVPNRKDS